MSRALLAAAVLLLTSCSAGTSAVDGCVEHSVDEGVEEPAARAACEDAVGEDR